MDKVTLKITRDVISPTLKSIQKELDSIPLQALDQFVQSTPKDKGNARRKTSLANNKIQANYPYASRLDQGYSKKAPRGMTKPLREWLSKKLNQIIRKR